MLTTFKKHGDTIYLATPYGGNQSPKVGWKFDSKLPFSTSMYTCANWQAMPSSVKDVPFSEVVKQVWDELPLTEYFITNSELWKTGGDPEIFAFDKSGKLIPAWEYLAKTDTDDAKTGAGKAVWDGVQAEIQPLPKRCHAFYMDSTYRTLRKLWTKLKAHNPTAYLECHDVVKLPAILRKEAKDEHILLGCAPSLNAYGLAPIEIENSREHVYRYSGVHMHHSISYNSLTPITRPPWWPIGNVVAMDRICGLMLTALGRDMENPIRRQAYGRPGEFRLPGGLESQDYRLEYRTPGAFLMHRPEIYHLGLEFSRIAYLLSFAVDGRELPIPDVTDIIMECDADAAAKIIKANSTFFINCMKKFIFGIVDPNTMAMDPKMPEKMQKATLATIIKGAKASGLMDKTVAEHWYLDKEWLNHSNNNICTWNRLASTL